jgi:hypothetical protein
MATKLSDDELVSFKELLMANEIAVAQPFFEKGTITRDELLTKTKQIQIGIVKGTN